MSAFRVIPDGSVTTPKGWTAGAVYCGIKTPGPGKLDLGILVSDRLATVSGTFTTNAFCAAPVQVSKEIVQRGHARAVVINAGNANACTGERGILDAREMCTLASKRANSNAEEVLVASTGVIGVPLPMNLVHDGISSVELGAESGHIIARAIMTTDTRPKEVAVELNVSGTTVRIGGMAKGAGMIHPNMATMLAFVTTDAAVDLGYLRQAVPAAVGDSFNMISIDGDTSTNDTLLVLANGAAGNAPINGGDDGAKFTEALTYVCAELAKKIVMDGEGATKLIRCDVLGARTSEDARKAARSVVSSNLLKCAVYGGDPNWGRVLCAIGYSGAHVDPSVVELHVGDVQLVKAGSPVAGVREAAGEQMKKAEVHFIAKLNVGEHNATGWGCDMTEAYVVENSAYTT
jgi:glutamate N-acetyltransferase/amino-acid N-acetyltransferase